MYQYYYLCPLTINMSVCRNQAGFRACFGGIHNFRNILKKHLFNAKTILFYRNSENILFFFIPETHKLFTLKK